MYIKESECSCRVKGMYIKESGSVCKRKRDVRKGKCSWECTKELESVLNWKTECPKSERECEHKKGKNSNKKERECI